MPQPPDPKNFGTPPNPGITTNELLAHAQALYEFHSSVSGGPPWAEMLPEEQTGWLELVTLAARLNGREPVQRAG